MLSQFQPGEGILKLRAQEIKVLICNPRALFFFPLRDNCIDTPSINSIPYHTFIDFVSVAVMSWVGRSWPPNIFGG